MTHRRFATWTSADEARLADLASMGLSATDIAWRMGGDLTRHAVLGKARRMGLRLRLLGERRG